MKFFLITLIKSLLNCLGFVLNPSAPEFPTGLELPRTIRSLVCSQSQIGVAIVSAELATPLSPPPPPLTSEIPQAASEAQLFSSLSPAQLTSF